MKYEFGVMSSRYELEAEDDLHGKLAMCLFIGQNIPIAIYLPKQDAFCPVDFMMANSPETFVASKVQAAFKSISKLR